MWQSVLSFSHVDPKDQTGVVKLKNKWLYLLSYFARSSGDFYKGKWFLSEEEKEALDSSLPRTTCLWSKENSGAKLKSYFYK